MMWKESFTKSFPKLRPTFYVGIILINALLTSATTISDQLKFCSRSDPKLNECLKSCIQAALVALKDGDFPNDPIRISQGTVKATPPLTFDQQYTDLALYNVSALSLKNVRAEIDDASFSITIEGSNSPLSVVTFNYNFENANLGGFDVSSKGSGIFYEHEKTLTFTLNGRLTKKGGIDYADITDCKFDYVLEKLTSTFQSDNVEAAQELTSFVNENWSFLFSFEEKGFAEMYAKGYRDYAQRIFDIIPYDQLFPK